MKLKERVIESLCKFREGKYIILSQMIRDIDSELKHNLYAETSFLDDYSPRMSDRVKYVLEDRYEVNRCNQCSVPILDLKKKYCSCKCNNNSKETKDKFRNAYNNLSEEEKTKRNEKRTKTVNERYGGYTLESEILSPKVRKTMKKKYGVEYAFQSRQLKQKAVDTWIEKYGVDNPFKSEEVKDLIREVLKERYGVENSCYIDQEGRVKKATQTKIERGLVRPEEFLTEYQKYSKEVRRLTEKTYRKYKHVINPNSVKRVKSGREGYQLDHKYSIIEGFLNDVEPSVISSRYNLQMLKWEDNIVKSGHCHISLKELKRLIENEV